jgi:hypothetical protein
MKLTPFAKFFVTLIILGVVGYVLYVKRDTITQWANQGGVKPTTPIGDKPSTDSTNSATGTTVSKEDFAAIGAAREAGRQGVTGIAKAQVGSGKLNRKLRVGINTWAGHAPGIVANGGLDPAATKRPFTCSKYGLDVEFTLARRPPDQAGGVPQGRHRHHVGHRRFLGSRGFGAGGKRQGRQGHHSAGLVAWWRWHRGADWNQKHRGSEAAKRLRRRALLRRIGCSCICCRSPA